MDTDARRWTQDQATLRRLLARKGRAAEAQALFFRQHAQVHSAAMAGMDQPSFEDALVDGLSEAEWRAQPRDANSITWLIWHAARTEDLTLNLLVAGRPQVLTDEDWLPRLGLTRADIGTGMADEEVAAVGAALPIPALRAYRVAVGRRTREIVAALSPADLHAPIDPARPAGLVALGALDPRAAGLAAYWAPKRVAFFLTMPATSHPFRHLREAARTRRALGR